MRIERIQQFLLDKEKDKQDARLRFRIKWNNSKNIVSFGVGFRVDINKWSTDTQRCFKNTTHGKKKVSASIINNEIQFLEEVAVETFEFFEQQKKVPTEAEFRKTFNEVAERVPKENLNIISLFDKYIEHTAKINAWSKSTKDRHKSLRKHLYKIIPNVTSETVSEQTMLDIYQYFTTVKTNRRGKERIGLNNSTIAKNMQQISSFFAWAKKEGLYRGNLDKYRLKYKGVGGNINEIVFLSWNELLKLFNYEFDNKTFANVRDIFCLCCFTSLRFSDVSKLKKADITDTHIKVITNKTVEGLKIELDKYSKEILNRHKNIEYIGGRALPSISITSINDIIKEIGKILNFNEKIKRVVFVGNQRYEHEFCKYELLSTHCGRRTFIVNALYLGIPAEVIMSWTGHSDYTSMKPYVKIIDELKDKSMKLFDTI